MNICFSFHFPCPSLSTTIFYIYIPPGRSRTQPLAGYDSPAGVSNAEAVLLYYFFSQNNTKMGEMDCSFLRWWSQGIDRSSLIYSSLDFFLCTRVWLGVCLKTVLSFLFYNTLQLQLTVDVWELKHLIFAWPISTKHNTSCVNALPRCSRTMAQSVAGATLRERLQL